MHELLYLPKSHPTKIRQHLNFIINPDDNITIAFTEKTSTLLTLKLIKQHIFRLHIYEIIQIGRLFAPMDLSIVTLSCLQSRANLDTINISWLNFSLHEKI